MGKVEEQVGLDVGFGVSAGKCCSSDDVRRRPWKLDKLRRCMKPSWKQKQKEQKAVGLRWSAALGVREAAG